MTRRLRRTAILAGALAVLAWPLFPSAHAQNPSVQLDQPGTGQTFESSTPIDVSGRAGFGLGAYVDRIRVQIVRGDGAVIRDVDACGPCPRGSSVPFSARPSAPSENGVYRVRVIALGSSLLGSPLPDGRIERTVSMNVPPDPPTGVTAQVLDGGRVRLSWTGVSHEDLIGYGIYRKVPGGTFQAYAGSITGTSWTDEKAGEVGGAIEYRVAAVRWGAQRSESSWLVSESAAVVATLPAVNTPTTPTTTPNNPGAGDDDDGGDGAGVGDAGGAIQSDTRGPGLELGSFFTQSGASDFGLPASASVLPIAPDIDAGFSANLPFSTEPAGKIQGRQPGRPSTASGTGSLDEPGATSESNRRALLVPVAAGSVLCVAALHMRWLSRRLEPAMPGDLATFDTVGDLEHAEPDLDTFFPRQPVGAGR